MTVPKTSPTLDSIVTYMPDPTFPDNVFRTAVNEI